MKEKKILQVEIGNVYFYLQDYKKAEEAYVEAINDKDGEYYLAYSGLGNIYYKSGKYKQAVEFWQKYLPYENDANERIFIERNISIVSSELKKIRN